MTAAHQQPAQRDRAYMRTIATLVFAASAMALSGCFGVEPSPSRPSNAIRVEILDNHFDVARLQVLAGSPAEITVDNHADGIPHNLSVYTDDTAALAIAVGEVMIGPAVQTLPLPALSPGTYFFRCDIHRIEMVGTLEAASSPAASP